MKTAAAVQYVTVVVITATAISYHDGGDAVRDGGGDTI
jgi:hypothetical protein